MIAFGQDGLTAKKLCCLRFTPVLHGTGVLCCAVVSQVRLRTSSPDWQTAANQNAFDTLHDFQSCALDQLSHLSTSFVLPLGGCPWRSTIIPETSCFVKDFFEKNQTFLKTTKKRDKALCCMDGRPQKRLTYLYNGLILRAKSTAAGHFVPQQRNRRRILS